MPSSKTAPTLTVLDGLGTDVVAEIDVDTLKWRFFELGLLAGIALQMFAVSLVLILAANDAINELSALYYPLFRGCFLLSFFGVLFGLLTFAWKRTGIDYAMIFNVSASKSNYHAILREACSLMVVNFVSFITYWLTCTVQLTPSKAIWPLAAFLGTLIRLGAPFDWMPQWQDASQRAALVRTAGRALLAPVTSPSFATSFVADVFTSMPKCFIDLLFSTCIYASGEALFVGEWHERTQSYDRGLAVCTTEDAGYHAAYVLLSALPFVIRLLQCARQISDSVRAGGRGWRQPLANASKYCMALFVVLLSIFGGRTDVWLAASICSTAFAFSWDVLIDWGLGPQPLRRALRRTLEPDAPPSSREFDGASWWLRPVRVFPTSWYVTAVGLDLLARLGWAVYISPGQTVVAQHVTLLLGTVELFRRALWSLFRVEWEQIRRVAVEEARRKSIGGRLSNVHRSSAHALHRDDKQQPSAPRDEAEAERAASLRQPLLASSEAATASAASERSVQSVAESSDESKEDRIHRALQRNIQRMETKTNLLVSPDGGDAA